MKSKLITKLAMGGVLYFAIAISLTAQTYTVTLDYRVADTNRAKDGYTINDFNGNPIYSPFTNWPCAGGAKFYRTVNYHETTEVDVDTEDSENNYWYHRAYWLEVDSTITVAGNGTRSFTLFDGTVTDVIEDSFGDNGSDSEVNSTPTVVGRASPAAWSGTGLNLAYPDNWTFYSHYANEYSAGFQPNPMSWTFDWNVSQNRDPGDSLPWNTTYEENGGEWSRSASTNIQVNSLWDSYTIEGSDPTGEYYNNFYRSVSLGNEFPTSELLGTNGMNMSGGYSSANGLEQAYTLLSNGEANAELRRLEYRIGANVSSSGAFVIKIPYVIIRESSISTNFDVGMATISGSGPGTFYTSVFVDPPSWTNGACTLGGTARLVPMSSIWIDDFADTNGDDCEGDDDVPAANDGPGGAPPCGMAWWRVSEPYINLWLHDTPLRYRLSSGQWSEFKISYKQRNGAKDSHIGGFGDNWECNWIGFVGATSGTIITNYYPGGGGGCFYGAGGAHRNGKWYDTQTIGGVTIPIIWKPTGSYQRYGGWIDVGLGYVPSFLTNHVDRYGRTSAYLWAGVQVSSQTYARLTTVTDRDGRNCTLTYNNATFPQLITSVTDPYSRAAYFIYDHLGRLTNITDTAGMKSAFSYSGSSGEIVNLNTPYGNTAFAHHESGSPLGGSTLNRAIVITEPDGSKQIYSYRDNGYIGSASAGGTYACRDSAPGLRNSFHWDRKQYDALSSTAKASPLDMPVADYLKGSLKHWVWEYKSAGPMLADVPAATAGPVVAASGDTRIGQSVLKYQGQVADDMVGTLDRVTQIIWNGTTYSSGTSERLDIGRNSKGRPTSVSWWLNGTAYGYTNTWDASGTRLLTVTGPRGEAMRRYGYHATYTNLLTSVTNALGEVIRYTHDSNKKLTSITYPSGLVTTNNYYTSGAVGFLETSADVGFRTNSFTYSNGNLASHTDELGLTTTQTWDALNRLTAISYPDSTTISNWFDATRKLDLVGTKDRLNNWTRFKYNDLRQLEYVTNANGHVTQYSYCSCGSPSSIIRWNGGTAVGTTYEYDLGGRLTYTIYADGYTVTNTYDGLNRIISAMDSGSRTVSLSYNDDDAVTKVQVGGLDWLKRGFDEYGREITSTNRNGVVVSNSFDVLDRLTNRWVMGVGSETFAYTARGLTNHSDPLANKTWFVFDAAGRLSSQTNAKAEVLQFTYRSDDQIETLKDGLNHTTTWKYDEYGRVTNKLDNLNQEVFRYGYDANSRLTSRWTPDKGGVTTSYSYDALGNLTGVDYPGSTMDVALTYDLLDRLTNVVDAVGTTAFAYNGADQLTSEDGPWTSDTVSYTYSHRLRSQLAVQRPSTSDWTQTYAYDHLWRLTNTTSPVGPFVYNYPSSKASSLFSTLTLAGGSQITNSYDSASRLVETALKSAATTRNKHTYELNAGSQRTKQTFHDGNYVDYTYDAIGQLKTATGKESGGSSRSHEQMGYAYDAAGNLAYRTNNGLTQTFTVDTLNQLTNVSRSGTYTVAGAARNPPSTVFVAGTAYSGAGYSDRSFAIPGIPLSDGSNFFRVFASFSEWVGGIYQNYGVYTTNVAYLPASPVLAYDRNGNLTNDSRRVFAYDYENQLTNVFIPNTWQVSYGYDAFGRCRWRKEASWNGSSFSVTNEVRYVYDGMLVVQERSSANAPLISYTRGLDLSQTRQGAGGIGGLLARTDYAPANPLFTNVVYHCDGNGNVTALAMTNGVLVARYSYDPFGTMLASWGPLADANVYRFSSKEWHALTGLYYYVFRFYEPSLQRWVNRDPLGDIGSLVYQTAAIAPWNEDDGDQDELTEGELQAFWIQVNRNLYGGVRNDPINRIDGLGLADCPAGMGPGGLNAENLAALDTRSVGEIARAAARQALKMTDKQARATLRSAMRTPKGQAANHNIPWQMKENPLVKKAAEAGWNINKANNGTNLPNNLHSGWKNWHSWHEWYNKLAKARLDKAWKEGMTPEQAAAKAQEIADKLGRIAIEACK